MAEAESDARDYVLAIENDKAGAALIAKTTATKLESRSVQLLTVVQSVGEYINDPNAAIRARAISYLVDVISALPPKFLTRQQIQVLSEFLCDRIEDGASIQGLAQLAELDRFNDEMAQAVLRRVCAILGGELQQKPQRERWPVYGLVNILLDKRRKGVRAMGAESLAGIVALVTGEKDPRNLMLIFSMLRVIMVEWDISSYEERLFDAVYAYFPITFRPPPNDPYGITAQDLKDRLKACLASNGRLAPQVFPNLLDRLDSTSEMVKKDTLQALATCVLDYQPSVISQYSITLWDAIKFEVLQAQEPFLADEALIVLKNIATCLSRFTNENHGPTANPLMHYLKAVNKETLEHLSEPASRQAKASGDILKAIASASIPSFETVMKGMGLALLTTYQSADSILSQRAVLEMTNKLFEAAVAVYGSWLNSSLHNPDGKEVILVEFKDQLVTIYSQALMGTVKEEVSFRLTATRGLLLLSQMRNLLADNEIGLFVQYFNDIVLKEESYGRDELKKSTMTALANISKFKPKLITDITFPAFMARLSDSEEEASQAPDYRAVLEGLTEISAGRELVETLTRRLLNKLDILLQSDPRSTYPYTCAILSAIHYVLDRGAKDKTAVLDTYYDRVVVGLGQQSVRPTGPLTDEVVLDLLGRIINLIIRNSAPIHIGLTAENVYRLFRDPASFVVADGHWVRFEPPTSALISTWQLAALPRDMMLGVLNPLNIPVNVDDLVEVARDSGAVAVQFSCFRQISLYINKHLPAVDIPFADEIMDRSFAQLRSGEAPHTMEFSIRLIFTVSKALVLRLAPGTTRYLSDLISLLDSTTYTEKVSRIAAAGFGTILAPDDVLSKVNFAQVRLLAPQRIFQTLVPLISTKFKETESPTEKENHLIALSGILGTISSDVVTPEIPILLPLLLQSLDISDHAVKIATLDTLAVVITTNAAVLEESGHIGALLKRLLTTASSRGGKEGDRRGHASLKNHTGRSPQPTTANSPRVRHLATRCLKLMPQHITSSAQNKGVNPLLAQKREVLQGLMYVLDDPRRDIRKEAVDARASWLRGVDDIDSDDDD